MLRKLTAIVGLLVSVLSVQVAQSVPASAAIGDCTGRDIGTAIYFESCIYVDNSNGRATARIYWEPNIGENPNVRLVVTIQRSGSSATNNSCQFFVVTSGSGTQVCNAYIPNISGTQAWRSDAGIYFGTGPDPDYFLQRSATVYDT